jgi:hypothetical protein
MFCHCPKRVIQPVPSSKSAFEVLGLPPTFKVDLAKLSLKFRELQRHMHPDKFANASDQARVAHATHHVHSLLARFPSTTLCAKSPLGTCVATVLGGHAFALRNAFARPRHAKPKTGKREFRAGRCLAQPFAAGCLSPAGTLLEYRCCLR